MFSGSGAAKLFPDLVTLNCDRNLIWISNDAGGNS